LPGGRVPFLHTAATDKPNVATLDIPDFQRVTSGIHAKPMGIPLIVGAMVCTVPNIAELDAAKLG
jgi:hypothetical protein